MTTSTRPPLSGLLDLVSRFRASGRPGAEKHAEALENLAKGYEDIERLRTLAKAAGVADDADPETASEEGKDDTTEDEGAKAELDKGCSGEPMDKGTTEPEVGESAEHEAGESKKEEEAEHGVAKGTADADPLVGVVDATDLVKGLDARIEALLVIANQALDEQRAATRRQDALEARLANMEALAKGTQDHVGILGKALDAMGEHVATGFVSLAKASGEAILLSRELAPGVAGITVNAQRAAERLGGDAGAGRDEHTFTVKNLIKGQNLRIISEAQAVLYQRTGLFSNDAAIHEALSIKLRDAISAATTTR